MLILPSQYLGDAAVGYLEYPGDITGPGPAVSQLHDLLSGGVRQRPPGHEDSAQLVDPTVTCSAVVSHTRGDTRGGTRGQKRRKNPSQIAKFSTKPPYRGKIVSPYLSQNM